MAASIVVAGTTDLNGVTSQASATWEAPAQAELRPTCAGTPRVNLPIILALMMVFSGDDGEGSRQCPEVERVAKTGVERNFESECKTLDKIT
jgi:hypothetical protein